MEPVPKTRVPGEVNTNDVPPTDKVPFTVREFDPPYRLSWESVRNDIQGYHAWMIVPTEAGCKVITSESQHGLKAFLQKAFLPNKLRKLHDVWLEEFKRKAENEAISEIN